LKPVVPIHTTEVAGVETVHPLNLSRDRWRCTLPCENDQAKPDRSSRLARSTLLSKILQNGPPERCPFGSRLRLAPECPRTYCAGLTCVHRTFKPV